MVVQNITKPDLLERATGAYLGLAIGDALGATVEFMSPASIKSRFGVHNSICGGGWLNLKAGDVTDDTTMSLALGNAILQSGCVNAENVARSFSDWLCNDPVDVGNTVRRGIVHFRYSDMPYMTENTGDAGNGACMRTLPVALATYGLSQAQIHIASQDQAHITHNNPLSDAATECVINIIHACLDQRDKTAILSGTVRQLINQFPDFEYLNNNQMNPSAYIVQTMRSVFQAFDQTDSFEDCLINVVNRGGDADTTGAIAGMIAGCYYGIDAIPEHWLSVMNISIVHSCMEQAKALLMLQYGSHLADYETSETRKVIHA